MADHRDEDGGRGQAAADGDARPGAGGGEAPPPDPEDQERAETRGGDGEGPADQEVDVEALDQQAESDGHRAGHGRPPAEVAHLAPEDVLGQGAGHRDQQARGGREEGGEGPRRHQARQQLSAETGEDPAGEGEHDRVRPLGQVQVGGVEPAEGAVDGREDVEGAEQHQHDQRRLPGRPPVGVRVEADEDVGQAHRAEERRQHQRVGEEQRMAPLVADGAERAAPGAPVGVGLPHGVGGVGAGREDDLRSFGHPVGPRGQRHRGRPAGAVDGPVEGPLDPDGRGLVDLESGADPDAHHRLRLELRRDGDGEAGRVVGVVVGQQHDGRQGDRRHLEPVLEGLNERDPLHAAEEHVGGDEAADPDHADPVGRAEDRPQGDPRPLELGQQVEPADEQHEAGGQPAHRQRVEPALGEVGNGVGAEAAQGGGHQQQEDEVAGGEPDRVPQHVDPVLHDETGHAEERRRGEVLAGDRRGVPHRPHGAGGDEEVGRRPGHPHAVGADEDRGDGRHHHRRQRHVRPHAGCQLRSMNSTKSRSLRSDWRT